MAKTVTQIINDAKVGKFSPVYLFTGAENYYIDQLSDYFENNIVPEENRVFDQTVVYGRDVEMLQVIETARQMPMMGSHRLVLVKEAQDIGGTPQRSKSQWELLVKYLENPNPTTILVFCYRHKDFDKRSKAYKAMDAKGTVFEHKGLRDYQVKDEVLNMVSTAGFRISEKAAILIAASIGTDLAKIHNELSKLYISLKPGEVITEDLIERNIGISKEYNVFELQSAIGRRDVAMCTRIVNHFAANPKDNPLQMVLSMLYGYIIKIMIFIQAPDRTPATLAKSMGINPYFLRDYEVAAQNYSLAKLASCIAYLYEADTKSKGIHNTGTITDGEILKELIFKITH